jgi:hypothetical protein
MTVEALLRRAELILAMNVLVCTLPSRIVCDSSSLPGLPM